MNVQRRLHNLLDYAIDTFKEHNADEIPDPDEFSVDDVKHSEPDLAPLIDASGDAELWTKVWALRERDRAVARPVILRTLGNVLQTSDDVSLRQEAVAYLGESWDYYEDDSTVVRTLTAALFDTADSVQHKAVTALSRMGRAATRAIPALETVRSQGGSSALCIAIESAMRRIKRPGTR